MDTDMKASEAKPIIPAGNVQSERLQAETNALLREMIGLLESIDSRMNQVVERLDNGITTYDPH